MWPVIVAVVVVVGCIGNAIDMFSFHYFVIVFVHLYYIGD